MSIHNRTQAVDMVAVEQAETLPAGWYVLKTDAALIPRGQLHCWSSRRPSTHGSISLINLRS